MRYCCGSRSRPFCPLDLDRPVPGKYFRCFNSNELRTATAAASPDKLGDILVREGLITLEQLKKALQEQKSSGMRLGYTLVKLGFIEETEVTKMLARQYRMPAVGPARPRAGAPQPQANSPRPRPQHTPPPA